MDSHFLDGAQMTKALVRGEIIQAHMILRDGVLITIVKGNAEDVIIKSHEQDSVAINIVTSNKEGTIIKGHNQDSFLISSRKVTAVISDMVDAIYSCDEPVSHLGSK